MADLIKDLEAGKTTLVYYLSGERFPLEQAVTLIKTTVLGGEGNAFNFDSLQADVHGAEGILAAARTVPMFGAMRLVQVRDAHLLKADALVKLLPYIKDPSPSTCLLMIADKVDMRLKFFSELKKRGVVNKFVPLKERQAPAWVSGQARKMRVALKPGAAERICEAVGTDMAQLASALEKLSLYVGDRGSVTPQHVDQLLAQTRQHSIFELTNAVGRNQRRQALLVLHRMLQDREPGVKIVIMLARQLRQVWSAKELAARGVPQKAMASKIGVHPFFVKDIVRQAESFSLTKLRQTHRALFETDRALKSSRLDDVMIMERLVMTLCP